MLLQSLRLTNFRNYAAEQIRCAPQFNVVAGDNGMGKTNLLDAVHYLCLGKSYFSAQDRYVVRQQESFFRLEGRFLLDDQPELIVAKVQPGKQKVLSRNEAPYQRISEHTGLLPVVFMVPDDTALAMDGAEERRRFLDNTLCQLDRPYLEALLAYNGVLEKRNALLRQSGSHNPPDTTLLDVYDQLLLEPARTLFRLRQQFISDFQPVFQRFYRDICRDTEAVGLSYASDLLTSDLALLLRTHRQRDVLLQRTSHGIHRDDLPFSLDGKPLKRFASQGQLKSFVLALKLAQATYLHERTGKPPILLLDDLFDKLDDHRVLQLIGLLSDGSFGQVFLSDTHPDRAAAIADRYGLSYEHFLVRHGSIVR
ncbi:MAG: hypothetical protein RLY31_2414 [Bacteroidota bacterium]|jgi:DNA replication and repair protein RecF